MYKYRVVTFRDGNLVQERVEEISGIDLEHKYCRKGREGFLDLINAWNIIGLLGVKQSGIIYVYHAVLA